MTSTPTPVQQLSEEDAQQVYLKTICPLNSSLDWGSRATSYSQGVQAEKASIPLYEKAISVFDATAWPSTIETDVETSLASLKEQQGYAKSFVDAGSQEAADALPDLQLQGKGPEIREALGLPSDSVEACVGDTPYSFPDGYPKKVKTSTLPTSWRSNYSDDHVLQLAPGVWSKLDPGATWSDTVAAAQLDGFCGSKKAFERKFFFGQPTSGSCD